MAYRFLADLLVVLHRAFGICVVFGGALVLWRRRFALLHVLVAIWGVYSEITGGRCPLTVWEVRLRDLGGQAGYSGSFVDQYLMPVLYPPGLTREQQIYFGVLIGLLNLVVYGIVVWGVVKERRKRGADPD